MKKIYINFIFIIMSAMQLSCVNSNEIQDLIRQETNSIANWHDGDNIPDFILINKYSDNYYPELYEHGGFVNVALINNIKNKNLLLKIISECDKRLDRKPSLKIFKNINFGINRLFDFYFNYSSRQMAILRYRLLYGSEDLADQIKHLNPNCSNLNSDTVRLINSIKFSANDHASIGFIIKLKASEGNSIKINQTNITAMVSHILKDTTNMPSFKELDFAAAEIIKSTTDLNPDATFQIDYTGPYISFKVEKQQLRIIQKKGEIIFTVKVRNAY